jgi:hypothetical protein
MRARSHTGVNWLCQVREIETDFLVRLDLQSEASNQIVTGTPKRPHAYTTCPLFLSHALLPKTLLIAFQALDMIGSSTRRLRRNAARDSTTTSAKEDRDSSPSSESIDLNDAERESKLHPRKEDGSIGEKKRRTRTACQNCRTKKCKV